MKMENLKGELTSMVLVSCQRALLGVITPGIRAITIEWDGLKSLSLHVCYEQAPSEDDIEDMEIVTTEILADVPFEHVQPVNVIISGEPMDALQLPGRMVYMRKE